VEIITCSTLSQTHSYNIFQRFSNYKIASTRNGPIQRRLFETLQRTAFNTLPVIEILDEFRSRYDHPL